MMRAPKRAVAVAAAVVGLAAAAAWGTARTLRANEPLVVGGPLAPAMTGHEITSREIERVEARVAGDPRAARDRAALASLYLQRSRETGDFEDYRRAEAMARGSLEIRVRENASAARLLAAALLAQHRFTEAHQVAAEMVRAWPEEISHRALLAELQMELGDYEGARGTIGSLQSARKHLAVLPRLARWAEMTGDYNEEGKLLAAAVHEASFRPDLPSEQVAWFHLRAAEHALRTGHLDAAEQSVRAGLTAEPNDFRLVAVMVRVEAQRGRWERAVRYGEILGDAADMRTLGVLGDAHAALGDSAAANRHWQAVEDANAENPEPFARQWTQFRLDHDRAVPQTLALLQEEIRTRRDVLGYDLLAWALHKSGRHAEARDAMRQALRTGSRDPLFLFHAGMIEQALGNRDGARRYLRDALEVNPRFHHRFAQQARETLAEL
jgi:tetratricopeptide (TPR) repeat protein